MIHLNVFSSMVLVSDSEFTIIFIGKLLTNTAKQLNDLLSNSHFANLDTIRVSGTICFLESLKDEVRDLVIDILYYPRENKLKFTNVVLPCK